MRADILNDGMLRITPNSATEESMLNIWFADEAKNTQQIKDVVMVDSYEGISSCLTATQVTADKVEDMTAEMKKGLRKKVKEELTALEVEYNGRASTSTLQTILEKVKAMRNLGPQREPTKVEPPVGEEPIPEPSTPPVEEPAPEDVAVAPTPITLDTVREALKKFAATKGRTKAKKLLVDFDATKVSEIKEENYPAFLVAADVDNVS